jgi:hypothetical protein
MEISFRAHDSLSGDVRPRKVLEEISERSGHNERRFHCCCRSWMNGVQMAALRNSSVILPYKVRATPDALTIERRLRGPKHADNQLFFHVILLRDWISNQSSEEPLMDGGSPGSPSAVSLEELEAQITELAGHLNAA